MEKLRIGIIGTGGTANSHSQAGLRIPLTDCLNGTACGPMIIYSHVAGQPVEMEVPVLKDKAEDGSLWDHKIGSFITAIRDGGATPVPTSRIIKKSGDTQRYHGIGRAWPRG